VNYPDNGNQPQAARHGRTCGKKGRRKRGRFQYEKITMTATTSKRGIRTLYLHVRGGKVTNEKRGKRPVSGTIGKKTTQEEEEKKREKRTASQCRGETNL